MSGEGVHPSRDDLFGYRDGELPAEKRVFVEAHVVGCSVCRALIDEVSGLESALRRAEAEPGAGYYEALPDAVLRRIGGPVPGDTGARAAGGGRRGGGDREGRRVGAPPRMPWAAVLSTATAAAAVVVVAVVLVRNEAVRRALSPLPPPASEKQAATAPESRARGVGAVTPAESLALSPAGPRAVAPPTAAKSLEEGIAKDEERELAKNEAPGAKRDAAAERPGAIMTQRETVAGQEPSPGAAVRLAPVGVGSTLADQAAGARAPLAPGASEAYAAVLRRFNLPAVWNERVSTETLRQAEPELRYVYQTGRAGSDSARVRLYLAEAARLRYVPGQDAALLEQISHHYLRAIRLSGTDTVVAKIARERLSTLGP